MVSMTLINVTHMSHQISQSKSLRLSGTRSIEEGLLLSLSPENNPSVHFDTAHLGLVGL